MNILQKNMLFFIFFIASSLSVSAQLHERVYVQTDKNLYLAGESVLIKAITTDANLIPLNFSKVVYVELADNHASHSQIMIGMKNATGTGQMQLPVELPSGYYRLIAYTRYMRNEGSEVFFEKNIAVLNTFQSGYHPTTQPQEIIAPNSISNQELTTSKPTLRLNKTTYTTRELGQLTISGLPENIHTLTVSIAGKEPINAPQSSFTLFEKNRTIKTTEFSSDYIAEYEGHIINGKLINNQTNLPEGDFIASPAIAFPGSEIRFFSGQKNTSGDVKFVTSGVYGADQISSTVYNTDEKFRVDILSPFVLRHTDKQIPTLSIDTAHYDGLLARSVALQLFRYFSDDDVDAANRLPASQFKLKPSRTYPLDDYTRFATMRETVIEFVMGARFRRNDGRWQLSILTMQSNFLTFGAMPLVLFDGVPVIDHTTIYNYDPALIEHINLYYGPVVMGGYRFDGIIEILSFRRLHQDLTLNRATQVTSYNMPQMPYQSTTPDYSSESNRKSRLPDSRHTLLWKPEANTTGNTTITMPFNTSDLTGEFVATAEGITKDGKMVFAEIVFSVIAVP